MKVEIEISTLSQLIEALMFRANMTYRQLAEAIGENLTTVWRAVKNPSAASATVLFKIVRYLEISWDDFARLFAKEVKKGKVR